MNTRKHRNVYFDNLQITHIKSPLLQEQSYYPFGLQMAGISDKALGKLDSKNKFDGGVNFEEDYGVNLYSTFFRNYDPQIGRFDGMDMLSEKYKNINPYQYSINNPILYRDPTGAKTSKAFNDFYNSVHHAWTADDFGGEEGMEWWLSENADMENPLTRPPMNLSTKK